MGRARVQIKDEIVQELEKFPKTTHGVARAVKSHYDAAQRNLEELENMGVVVLEGEKWRLNK